MRAIRIATAVVLLLAIPLLSVQLGASTSTGLVLAYGGGAGFFVAIAVWQGVRGTTSATGITIIVLACWAAIIELLRWNGDQPLLFTFTAAASASVVWLIWYCTYSKVSKTDGANAPAENKTRQI